MTDQELLKRAADAMSELAGMKRCAATAGLALGLHTAATLLSTNVYAREAAATVLATWADGKSFTLDAPDALDALCERFEKEGENA